MKRAPGDLDAVWPNLVYMLDFVCSSVRFYLLFSPCICFVSFLCLGLCVLGDDALISWGYFVRAMCLGLHLS